MPAGLQTNATLRSEPSEAAGPRPGADMELLVESVRRALPGAPGPSPRPGLRSRVHWPQVLWRGRQHRALFFLREMLAAMDPTERPAAIWSQLTQLHEANLFRSMERGRELCLLHERLEQAGIPAVAMSGWAFAQRYYENPALRETGATTELLVDAADRARAEAALAAEGYVFGDDPLRLAHTRRSHVTLQTRLVPSARADTLSAARARARAEPLAIAGRTVKILAAPDWLLCLGAAPPVGIEANLLQAFDVGLLVLRQPALDWAALLDEARQARLEAGVLLALCTCRDVLALPLPAAVQARIAQVGGVERRARLLADGLANPPGSRWRRLRARVALQETWAGKWRVVATAARNLRRARVRPEKEGEHANIGRYAPTPPAVVKAMLRLAGAGPAEVVYDLGCGDGRVVTIAAREFGARGVGIDIDPQLIESARAAAAAAGVADRVSFACGDVLRTPVTGATIVCLYLQDFAYPALRKKLERELPRGTRVVSHNFVFPGWPPEKTAIVRSEAHVASHIYLWRL